MQPTSNPTFDRAPAHDAIGDSVTELLDEITPVHPALERLAQRRSATQPVETAITSYDRMHHRHNRH
jgi:hypothetical protein